MPRDVGYSLETHSAIRLVNAQLLRPRAQARITWHLSCRGQLREWQGSPDTAPDPGVLNSGVRRRIPSGDTAAQETVSEGVMDTSEL